MMRILSARPWALIVAPTLAPGALLRLRYAFSASGSSTSNVTAAPTRLEILHTQGPSPCMTRYCLPPVLMTGILAFLCSYSGYAYGAISG